MEAVHWHCREWKHVKCLSIHTIQDIWLCFEDQYNGETRLECEFSVDIIGKWTKIMRTIAIDDVEVAIGKNFFACIRWFSVFYVRVKLPKFKHEIACINGTSEFEWLKPLIFATSNHISIIEFCLWNILSHSHVTSHFLHFVGIWSTFRKLIRDISAVKIHFMFEFSNIQTKQLHERKVSRCSTLPILWIAKIGKQLFWITETKMVCNIPFGFYHVTQSTWNMEQNEL